MTDGVKKLYPLKIIQIEMQKKYPEPGKLYDHYKGGRYQVITLAKHSETGDDLVIYKSLHFGSIHARPLQMWFENVTNEQKQNVPRFQLYESK